MSAETWTPPTPPAPYAEVRQIGRWRWSVQLHAGWLDTPRYTRLGQKRADRLGVRLLRSYLRDRDRAQQAYRILEEDV